MQRTSRAAEFVNVILFDSDTFVPYQAHVIHIGKAEKDEPAIFGEAKHAANNVAKFRRVCGKRVAGATFSEKSFERRRSWPPAAGLNASN